MLADSFAWLAGVFSDWQWLSPVGEAGKKENVSWMCPHTSSSDEDGCVQDPKIPLHWPHGLCDRGVKPDLLSQACLPPAPSLCFPFCGLYYSRRETEGAGGRTDPCRPFLRLWWVWQMESTCRILESRRERESKVFPALPLCLLWCPQQWLCLLWLWQCWPGLLWLQFPPNDLAPSF